MEKEADQLFNLQQYKEALQLYKKCEQTFVILIRQAEIYDRIGKFKDAIKLYQEAFTLNNSNLRTLIKIGKLQTQIGQYEQAIQTYQQAISVDSKFGLAYGELAYTYYLLENHNLAVENFLKCSELITIVPQFLTQIGDELFNEYKYYTAKLYYSVALKIDPEFLKAYLGVIKVFHKIEKYEQSLGVCESLLQRDPNNIEGKLLKIKNLLDMKWIQQAQIQIEQLNALPSTNLNYEQEDQLIYLSAKLLFCQQFYEQCTQYILEALKRNPFELDLIVLNSQCLMETHCYEEALQELEKVFDVYQNHYEALQLECINNYNLRLIINIIEQRYLKNKIKT